MFNGVNLRNRLRVTKRTNPIHSIPSSGRGVKQSIPILFPLVSSNDVPIGGIYLYTDDLYEDSQREGGISPMRSSKLNEDKGKHRCYWHGLRLHRVEVHACRGQERVKVKREEGSLSTLHHLGVNDFS
ncbi:hypothetical protein LguiA_036248 [Lonicera macranthoides]